jgi:transcriptional regulator GlxA family with amidase domain
MCLSQSQLNRRIKAETGFSTSCYVLKVRLNKSKMMLAKSSKPIGEIAVECGFNDFAYFSHTFKKEFGMTPTCYQRLPDGTN